MSWRARVYSRVYPLSLPNLLFPSSPFRFRRSGRWSIVRQGQRNGGDAASGRLDADLYTRWLPVQTSGWLECGRLRWMGKELKFIGPRNPCHRSSAIVNTCEKSTLPTSPLLVALRRTYCLFLSSLSLTPPLFVKDGRGRTTTAHRITRAALPCRVAGHHKNYTHTLVRNI